MASLGGDSLSGLMMRTRSFQALPLLAITVIALLAYSFYGSPDPSAHIAFQHHDDLGSASPTGDVIPRTGRNLSEIIDLWYDPSYLYSSEFVEHCTPPYDIVRNAPRPSDSPFNDQSSSHPLFKAFEQRQQRLFRQGDLGNGVVIYKCDGGAYGACGGLGDRLRGILSVFFLAMATDRAFLIQSDFPSDLNGLLRPINPLISVDYNQWINMYPELAEDVKTRESWLKEDTDWNHMLTSDLRLQYNSDAQSDGESSVSGAVRGDMWFVRCNSPIHRAFLENRHWAEHGGAEQAMWSALRPQYLPGCVMRYLLNPTPFVLAKMEPILEKMGTKASRKNGLTNTKVVGVQIRSGGDGNFTDNFADPRPKSGWYVECADKIIEERHTTETYQAYYSSEDIMRFGQPYSSSLLKAAKSTASQALRTILFVASDSAVMREEIMAAKAEEASISEDSVLFMDFTPVHIDRDSKERAAEGFGSTIAEWLLLSESDYFAASRSTFSETAALRAFSTDYYVYPGHRKESNIDYGTAVCTLGTESTGLDHWYYMGAEKSTIQ